MIRRNSCSISPTRKKRYGRFPNRRCVKIMAQSDLAPILNRDRGIVASNLQELIQTTLDSYDSGMNVVRVIFDRADPPREVIDSFREVQAAEQERDKLEKQADAYANRVLASARGRGRSAA